MTGRAIRKIVTARKQREGGGFVVRRALGSSIDMIDPFLMLDHMGPINFAPGEALGAPDHPHRGFQTVSYLLQGGMQHRDSCGNQGHLKEGWVQWMTAGSGLIHAEMPDDDMMKNGGALEGFQLWVNLPARHKWAPPRYQDTPPERIPVAQTDDKLVSVKVIAGECLGKSATIETMTPIMMLDISIECGGSLEVHVPRSFNAFVYVFGGRGQFGKDKIAAEESQLLWLADDVDSSEKFLISCPSSSSSVRCLFLAGEPHNEPVSRHGPFVMTTKDEIMQCFDDYHAGRMGLIPGAAERTAQTKQAKAAQQANGSWEK